MEKYTRKLSIEQAQSIFDRYISGEIGEKLAKEFKVSKQTISSILHGKSYQEIRRTENLKQLLKDIKGRKNLKEECFPLLNEHQMNLINGSLLGDGWITKFKEYGYSKFCKRHTCEYSQDIFYLFEELKPYSCSVLNANSTQRLYMENRKRMREIVDKRTVGYEIHTKTHLIFSQLRNKWYPEGEKIVPKDLILNPEILATWYVDDGSNDFGCKSCKLFTNGFSLNDVNFLRYRLSKDLNLYSARYEKIKEQYILSFSGQDYYNFIDMVKPFIPWNCFQYKIEYNKTKIIFKNRPEINYIAI